MRKFGLQRIGEILGRGVRLRCPRCGAAPLFRGRFAMFSHCLACDLQFEREQGYFVGAIYVNYGVTAVIAIVGYYAFDQLIGMSLIQHLVLWCAFAVMFPLFFFRYARSLWLSFDYIFNPEPTQGNRSYRG